MCVYGKRNLRDSIGSVNVESNTRRPEVVCGHKAKTSEEARMEYHVTGAHMFSPPRVRAALPVAHAEWCGAPNGDPGDCIRQAAAPRGANPPTTLWLRRRAPREGPSAAASGPPAGKLSNLMGISAPTRQSSAQEKALPSPLDAVIFLRCFLNAFASSLPQKGTKLM